MIASLHAQISQRSQQQKKFAKDFVKNAIQEIQSTLLAEASLYDDEM